MYKYQILKKTYETLGIDEDQEINSVKDVFPEINEMITSDYLQFLFIMTALYTLKAGKYYALGLDDKKQECIERVYEFASTMAFIDESKPITIQEHDFINSNKYYT